MDIQNNRFYKYLLSDENIYLALYSVESYVFLYDLLSKEDKKRYQKLKDKFNEKYIIGEIIPAVRKEIERVILNKDEFIFVDIYFNPKKYEEGIVEFRPIHTTNLISQIACVSMLNLLIYEKIEYAENRGKASLRLSNLSRLIPSDFYGNRISLKPKELFKPWKGQYQKYTSLTNDYLKKYHASLEYKYEVTLDLQKFFPSVNPRFVCGYILERLPVTLTDEDKTLYTLIIEKLLYCKIRNEISSDLWKKYYYDGVEVEIKTEKGDFEKFRCFTKGIPQGMPQSYFFGNIAMIPIAEKFTEQFLGVGLYYVDDSVIFTNKVEENKFNAKLKMLNKKIDEMVSETLNKRYSTIQGPMSELERFYKIKVHEDGKSYYTKLEQADDGEIFLRCLSRESSHATTDIFRLYSEEEDNIFREKMKHLTKKIEEKLGKLSEKINSVEKVNELEDDDNSLDKNKEIKDRYKKFFDRLTRYYKFFRYRSTIMELMKTVDLKGLEKIIYKKEDNLNFVENFISLYKDDIWGVAVYAYRNRITDKKKIDKLKEYILQINKNLFGYDNQSSSYLYKIHDELFSESDTLYISEISIYDSLKKIVINSLVNYRQKHQNVVEKYINDKLKGKSKYEIMNMILPAHLYKCINIVNTNTEDLFRMVLNAIYSYLFSVEIEDSFIISKRNQKPLSYGELRILLFVRNSLFKEKDFFERNIFLMDYNNQLHIDYSILEVTEAFRTFVKSPIAIDNLILTHQYTCDIWKNGSKYLYFYTLHNQEHAIDLIKNVIKLIHTFSYLQISSLDFYIIFLACYLHDISMVNIPSFEIFLSDQEEANGIVREFQQEITGRKKDESLDVIELKGLLVQIYKKMDMFYENQVRERHAINSAAEIRNVEELKYLDSCLREFIAEIAVAHGYNCADIYFTKSEASDKNISMKFDKILLRLADVLDMSMYRISRPILYRNFDQMQEESAFHWLSHLLVRGWQLETRYEDNKIKELLTPGSIIEKVILTVYVEMTQLSQCTIKEKCSFVGINRKTLTTDKTFFDLECSTPCSPNGECNFLCRWFTEKNKDLLKEFDALNKYLKRIPDNFFGSAIVVRLEMVEETKLNAKQFELIKKYLEN